MRPITNPDFNSIFEDMLPLAKSNPQYIDAYLLTGSPEQKLVAAMIKDMPQSQAPAAPTQAPTQTVIDKLAQPQPQAQPQAQAPQQMANGGIVGLPIAEDMFDDNSYAGGGIVAFDKGGYLDAYNEYLKTLSDPAYDPLVEASAFDRFMYTPASKKDSIKRKYLNERNYEAKLMQLRANENTPGIFEPTTPQERQAIESRDKLIEKFKQGKFDPTGKSQPIGNNVALPQPLAAQQVIDPNKKTTAPVAEPNKEALPDVDKEKTRAPGPDIGNINYGLPNALAGMKVPKGATLDKAAFIGDAPTMSGIQALSKEAYDRAGVSEDAYDKNLSSITAKRGEIEGKGKDRAIGEFLMNLGFGAAGGTSQSALQNFGQAAGPAGKELISTMRELENKKDKLDEREFAVMDARNKFRQTRADSDLRNMQESEKEYRGAQRDYAKTEAQLQDNQIGREFAFATSQAQEAGQNARAILSAKLQEQGLKIQAFSAQTQRLANEKPELFTTILTNLEKDPAYQKATGVGRNKMITEAVSDAKSAATVNDNTLRTKVLDTTAKYFEPGGAGSQEYKKLLKTNPKAAEKMYKDYFNQQLVLAKSLVGAGSSDSNIVDFYSLK